jgi:hypothetical protein
VQDALAAGVALSLTTSVAASPPVLRAERDVPRSAGAYALYLRANQLAHEVTLARLGAHDRAAIELRRVVDAGFWRDMTFVRDSWLDPVRSRPDVSQLFEEARDHDLQC